MTCKYFGICGSCSLYKDGYEAQLKQKFDENQKRFENFYKQDIKVFNSPSSHYRARAEFRIWHDNDNISYAMTSKDKQAVMIDECPQVNQHIYNLMPKLLQKIIKYEIKHKLFGIDFLSSSNGDMVVSMLYHKRLDEIWEEKASEISKDLGISIIGRSKKQKIVIQKDYVIETLHVKDKAFKYKHIENSFTQPNPKVNEQMISWAMEDLKSDSDLLELYCGAGNFTIPFATKFQKILATEISKSSINAAKENMKLNSITNIEFVRMSVEEFVEALDGVRIFNRTKHIDLDSYDIKSVFVDPPRAGMDEYSCNFVSRYENIIYISCNPLTLHRDLEILSRTHKVTDMALFDQFPYTHHVEMGVKLTRI